MHFLPGELKLYSIFSLRILIICLRFGMMAGKTRKQIIKIRKEKMEYSFNSPGRKCIYVQPHSYTIENQQQNKHT
jgi:uncharacterized protein YvpB